MRLRFNRSVTGLLISQFPFLFQLVECRHFGFQSRSHCFDIRKEVAIHEFVEGTKGSPIKVGSGSIFARALPCRLEMSFQVKQIGKPPSPSNSPGCGRCVFLCDLHVEQETWQLQRFHPPHDIIAVAAI